MAAQHLRKRFFIISNPASGKSGQKIRHDVIGQMRSAGAEIEHVATTSHGEGCSRAREAAKSGKFDAVIAAGGDGTIHDVACGLIGTPCPLGIIPMGTANVFAREVGLGFSPARLAETLLSGSTRSVPVGIVNDEIFLFVIGVGFDAAAVEYFETGNHRGFGIGGFIPPVLQALVSENGTALQVSIDGTSHEAHWVIVTRVQHYAANILLAEEASLHGDKLYAVLFSGASVLARIRQLAAMMTGMLKYDPGISVISCRQLQVKADQPVPVQVDGEAKGKLPLEIGIHPERLNIIFPPHNSDQPEQ